MDSQASFHVTPHCKWFTSYDAKRTGQVLGMILHVQSKEWVASNSSSSRATFTIKNVCHVIELTKSLILTGYLDNEGYTCVYGDNSWKITKGSMVVARGAK